MVSDEKDAANLPLKTDGTIDDTKIPSRSLYIFSTKNQAEIRLEFNTKCLGKSSVNKEYYFRKPKNLKDEGSAVHWQATGTNGDNISTTEVGKIDSSIGNWQSMSVLPEKVSFKFDSYIIQGGKRNKRGFEIEVPFLKNKKTIKNGCTYMFSWDQINNNAN
jgi:hypothetical protein